MTFLFKTPCLAAAAISVVLFTVAHADEMGTRAALQSPDQRKPAPGFTLKDANGKTVRLQDYRGKIVLLDFWATWCHGCKQEIPWFAEFHRKYGDQGLAVIGVSMDDEGWKVVAPFVKSAGISYQIVLGDQATGKKYAIVSMPDTFLIDREGRIAASYKGALVDRDDVEKNIRTVLDQK
jgi:peroxiredoxin